MNDEDQTRAIDKVEGFLKERASVAATKAKGDLLDALTAAKKVLQLRIDSSKMPTIHDCRLIIKLLEDMERDRKV